ncbi:MAG: DUF2889 domain-containing protein [Bdellovibrionaceae bacterium]|nr:DUF2889 domain-containing protein [Bdellovibrionales bacterium]MCB9083826.1 DUF2889 domain-containing protein [Pseudobdellovibrionaceae bacterium]
MKIYERNLNSSVRKVDEDHIMVETSLLDLNHSMRVEILVNTKTNVIENAVSETTKVPLKACDVPQGHINNIIGLKIERGINRKLIQILGGCDGCTHLYELALTSVRLTFNVLMGLRYDWEQWVSRSLSDDEFTKQATPHLKGSCYPFK